MKKEELMIGDWVSVSGTPLRIAALGTVRAGFLDGKGEMFYHDYDNIHPIPLTDKIIKWIFTCSYDDPHQWYTILEHNTLWLEQSRIELNTYYMMAFEAVKVRYVHELQHLLRLCGINKEIKL